MFNDQKDRTNVFIGGAYPKSFDDYYKKIGRDNFSNIVFNQTIIEEFERTKLPLFVLSTIGIGHFPLKSSRLFVKRQEINKKHVCAGYFNFIGLNVYSKFKSLKTESKKMNICKDNLNIIVSEMSIPYLKEAIWLKNRGHNNRITLIVLDLPEHVLDDKKYSIYNFLKKISSRKIMKMCKHVDSYVFLSELMNQKINVYNKPYFISPGIINLYSYDNVIAKSHDTIDICYCGTISKRFDIDFLINSFKKTTSSNLRLLIAGGGDGKQYVIEQTKFDSRIKYLGLLSRDEALQLQLSSDCLINPRLPLHDYSEYSFPSKIMNYLLTFKPVISYKTKAFPDDIASLLIVPENYSEETLAELFNGIKKGNANNKKRVLNVLENYTIKGFVEKLLALFS